MAGVKEGEVRMVIDHVVAVPTHQGARQGGVSKCGVLMGQDYTQSYI